MNKKIKLSLLALLLMFTLVLTGCFGNNEDEDYDNGETDTRETQTQNQNNNQNRPGELLEGFERFENDYYEIQFPSDWEQSVQEMMGIEMPTFAAPGLRASVNIAMEELPGRLDLDEYREASVAMLEMVFGNAIGEVNAERVTVNGLQAYRITYTHNTLGEYTQTMIVDGTRAFIITLLEVGGYEGGTPIYNQMLNTFVIK